MQQSLRSNASRFKTPVSPKQERPESSYGKSRQECQRLLLKQKMEMQQQLKEMEKTKIKWLMESIDRFNREIQAYRKLFLNKINEIISIVKEQIASSIRKKKNEESFLEESYIRLNIQKGLNQINKSLPSLSQDNYREYIVKTVISDLQEIRREVKQQKDLLVYPPLSMQIDLKSLKCIEQCLKCLFTVHFNDKRQQQVLLTSRMSIFSEKKTTNKKKISLRKTFS